LPSALDNHRTPRRMMLERGAHSNWAKNSVIRDVFWEWIADSMPEESKIEEVFGKLGQTSTNFKVKRGKSARNRGIDPSSSTQHRFRPGIPPSMSSKLVSSVPLFAGSRMRERVRNTPRPGASSSIADCPSRCWNKRVYLLVNCKENMIC